MAAIPCAVLAGEKKRADGAIVLSRSMELIANRPMVAWTLDALAASSLVSDIYVVGLSAGALGRDDAHFVKPGETFIDNLQRGLNACPGDRVLVATSDIPFLTPAAVDDFIQRAQTSGKEFCYSVVPVRLTSEKYPDMKRTAVALREDVVTGGNVIVISKAMVNRNAALISRIFDNRKNPVALARIFGLGFLLRLLIAPRTISLPALERQAESIMDGTVAAIVSEYPEIATDIDKDDDLAIARRMFENDQR